ncbi:site-specific DNA-methyltransferase [Sulfurovum sp.]|uniref:site-specific DNA-methyltransferase n=1 Tax=Sulfurovum sp. TaxID=1969726 RepID=UPI0025ED8463|nr:site-specific DNA-methyltransferase [Sulfurovum sp.]
MTLESLDIKQQKLRQLQQILPEIFEDGEIIPEKLKDVFADEVNESREHYSFTWAGKRDCYKTIREKTNATLKVDEDTTIPDGDNVFIEGDNLEVLKLLQLSYHKKVKMIYIDPPYNKDKDFVYSDTWGDSIQNYLIQTDQLRDEGYTTTKTNSTGRRHTNWLNMIYPRLWLSRNLLKDDGVIFVSIDDDEVHNLRKVMDEIYGEENFVGHTVWKHTEQSKNDEPYFSRQYNSILAYKKSDVLDKLRLPRTQKDNKNYSNLDNDINGEWRSGDVRSPSYRKTLCFDIETPSGNIISPPKNGWRWAKSEVNKKIDSGEIIFNDDETNIIRKIYLKNQDGRTPENLWIGEEYGTTRSANSELKELFENETPFDTPKPTKLIRKLCQLFKDDKSFICLDFFAGSGTTAHAVMALNQEDGGNRKYILVQLPEATDVKSEAYKAGYTKISDITKERIKRAMQKLDYKEGFKSFRLDNSNFQIFKEVKKRPDMSYEKIEEMLKMSMFHENILTQGAKELDIVYEVGLKNGFTLSAKVDEVKTDKYSFMTLSEEERVFYFSFDKKITGDIVHDVPKDAKLICYEKALTTNVKLNLRENLDLEVL